MIKLTDVSKKYIIDGNPFYALDKINLEIKKGEMVAIRGRSGAGKSTLLHILGCLDKFDEGSYLFENENIAGKKDSELAEIRNRKIGFVMQDFSLINHRTALYNVKSPMLFDKTPFFKMTSKAMKSLEKLGIADQAKKPVENMSGGQRQRVAIARALVNDPELILADEPTGNLDSETAESIMKIFLSLNREGKTVIIVTHDDVVAEYCTRSITISDGHII